MVNGKMALVVLTMALLTLGACHKYTSYPSSHSAEEAYLSARMFFNGLLEDYIEQKRLADSETKKRWSKEIDPWFEKGAIALKVWSIGLRNGEDTEVEMQQYIEIKNGLMKVVIQALIQV